MTSVLNMLSGLENTHVKDSLRDLGLAIGSLQNDILERITLCEQKLEEQDNILADISSRLTHTRI
jgi:hypothetical protein